MDVRKARIRSLAKVNLDLRVLHKRPDGYHELQTVFQTISLADRLTVSYTPKAKSEVRISGMPDVPDNIILRVVDALRKLTGFKGLLEFEILKNIPMGGGLGGGSSNAAAALLTIPVLAGLKVTTGQLHTIAENLGSDINFFLYGGTAIGLGRGTELYPLPDLAIRRGSLVVPGIHVSTAEAYGGLNRTTEPIDGKPFEECVWKLVNGDLQACRNDFESSVYRKYPKLRRIHSALTKAGAEFVRMSGSGSSIYAFFGEKNAGDSSILKYPTVHEFETVSRRQYQKLWWRQLREHIAGEIWPPPSRYAR
ncbi:MAG: 4-(cytidine 5'-diphospho)-2-C-methyl-D-erythritol kinase [Acidobacteria bacterium]|nr:4-(cytidine 5'-diphospho)-2-C-methyl-D-erythritol kinase [Acidobacteriota bacterium]